MSRYTSDDRFDFSKLLDWKKAQVTQGQSSGLQPDETYVLSWQIPYGSQEQAREWIYNNRQGFEAPELPFMQLSGFWRTVQVRYQVVEPKISNAGVTIQQVIASGYHTELDWNTARVLSGERSDSNTSSAGIDNTTSAAIQSTIQVRLPYIAPEAVNSILSTTSIPDPFVVRGNNYGSLKRIVSAARLEDDGSYSVLFTLADPQYTIESYADAGGTNEQDIVYLWAVPKDYAQSIIDAWKVANPVSASASADYNDSVKLVNIVLRKNALVKPNLTLAGINVACDTKQNFHFAWGYEKADIDAFIQSHNSPTGTGSRQVQVQSRADGLYDVTIIETVVTAQPPPHFVIALKTGTAITSTQKYGWNISIAQLNSIKGDYEISSAGQTKQFRVTREDNCTFDYEGVIISQTEQSAEVAITGEGIQTKTKVIRGTTGLSTGFTAGKRKRHRLELRKEDDGTNTITATEEEVKAGNLTKLSSGSNGISSEAGSFNNLDEIPTIPTSEKRVRVQPDIRINDDGTYTGGYQQTIVQQNAQSGSISGGGITTSVRSVANSDNVDTTFTANKRDRVSLSIQPNDDGTVNFTESKQTVVVAAGTASAGSDGINYTVSTSKNQDKLSILLKPKKKDRLSVSASANDDGTFDVTEVMQSLQESDDTAESGELGVITKVRAYKNKPNVSVSYTSGPRKRVSYSISPNDDGTFDYTETLQEVKTQEGTISPAEGPIRVKFGANREEETNKLQDLLDQGNYAIKSSSVSVKDDKTLDYNIVLKDLSSPVDFDHTYQDGQCTVEIIEKIGTRLEDKPNENAKEDGSEELDINLRPDEDGSLSWTSLRKTWKPVQVIGKSGTPIFREDLEVYQNQTIKGAEAIIESEVPDGEKHQVSLQIDEKSGKVSLLKVITTPEEVATTDTIDDGFIKRTVTRTINKTDPEPDLEDGQKGRVENRVNEYKKYDVIKETLTVNKDLDQLSETRRYKKNEREYFFTRKGVSGRAASWKELSSGEIRKKETSREWEYFGIYYIKRIIDITETVTYSLNFIGPKEATAPTIGEQEVTTEILPNGLFLQRTVTVTINEWEHTPVTLRKVLPVTDTGIQVVQKIEDDGESVKLEFGTTSLLGGSV